MKKLLIILCLLVSSSIASADTAKQIDFLLSGIRHPTTDDVLTGGLVKTYIDGTSTLSAIWTDRDKSANAANPFQLDASGSFEGYGDGVYKFEIYDSTGLVLLDTIDGLSYAIDSASEKLSEYGSCDLEEAVDSLGSTQATLKVDCAATLTDGSTVITPSTLTLERVGSGMIAVANGDSATLTVNGNIVSSGQIFDNYSGLTVNGTAMEKGIPAEWFGYSGDGSTDDTIAITALFRNALDGSEVKFSGTSIISDVFTIDKNISILGSNATFEAYTRLTAPVLTYNNASDFNISGLSYKGLETLASFQADEPTGIDDAYGLIYLFTCHNVNISNVAGTNARGLIKLRSSYDIDIDHTNFNGIITEATSGAPYVTGNYINACTDIKISKSHAESTGSVVLVGSTSERVVIDGVSATDVWDNGVYISSGNHCIVTNSIFYDIDGVKSAIKMRGNNNIASNNTMYNTGSPVHMSTISDAGTSYNMSVTGNTIYGYTGKGIQAKNYITGDFPTNVIISGNIIYGGTGVTGLGPAIEARVEKGLVIANNIIEDNVDTYAMYVWGGDNVTQSKQVSITGNVISNVNEGIRLSWVERANVSNNVFDDTTRAIRLVNVKDSSFIGNLYPESPTDLIKDDDAYENTGNIYALNYGNVNIDAAQQVLNKRFLNPAETAIDFGAADATPDVRGGNTFRTNASGALDVTDFDFGKIGQEILIISGDSGNTTIKHDTLFINLSGGADWVSNDGTSIKLWYDGSDWNESYRGAPTM